MVFMAVLGLMVGLNDLNELFQPEEFIDTDMGAAGTQSWC